MPSIGQELAGRYRLDAQIGSGGFATVFRARDLRLERDVAVKVLLANHATDPVMAARFEREARVLAALRHPNVVAIHDVAAGDPAKAAEPFLVMELSEGGSLADRIAERLAASRTGALPPDELIPILVDVAAGLAALHAQGIVHRDLKPSNVLLSDGRARIADLGIATIGPSDLTAVGTTVGTLAYLAPEQLAGEPGSAASDVHALGVIAFLGLTGRLPRPAGNVTEVVAASIQPVDPVSAVEPGLGTAFDGAIARALGRSSSGRPTTIELGTMLAAALKHWRAEPGLAAGYDATTLARLPLPDNGVAVPPAAAPAVAATWVAGSAVPGPAIAVTPRRGARPLAAVGIVLAALFLGLAGFVLFRPDGPGETASPSGTGNASASASASASGTAQAYQDARVASDEMRAAIAAARGSGGLNGREAMGLETLLDRFDRALDNDDPETAIDEANELAAQVAELIEQGDVEAQAGDRLQTAAEELVAAVNPLLG